MARRCVASCSDTSTDFFRRCWPQHGSVPEQIKSVLRRKLMLYDVGDDEWCGVCAAQWHWYGGICVWWWCYCCSDVMNACIFYRWKTFTLLFCILSVIYNFHTVGYNGIVVYLFLRVEISVWWFMFSYIYSFLRFVCAWAGRCPIRTVC